MTQMTRYETKLDAFEGPLDLLLHLIRETKVDIHEIKISEITEQYLTYIKAMEDLHLDIASEYLVMAANLMLIKSKKLLPKEEVEIEDDYEEDPEAELMRRLLEYQMYKDSIGEFRKLEEARGQFYTKPAIDFSEYIEDRLTLGVSYDTSALILAFEKLLRRQQLEAPIPTTIMAEKVTVTDRIEAIKDALSFKKRIRFSDLFERFDKEYIVVTFLAMLEMAKAGEITLLQRKSEDDIEVMKNQCVHF
jgi:segregation and condensation protein A